MVGVVQGVEQLVHPVIGLAVSIETRAHRSAVGKTPKLEVTPGGDGFFQHAIFECCFNCRMNLNGEYMKVPVV